jgi:hypothetical protein
MIKSPNKSVSEAELEDMAERLVTWLKQNHNATSLPSDPTRWTIGVSYLSSAQRSEDRRALAVSQALMILLGRTMDVSSVDFQRVAAMVRSTRKLADNVRAWRTTPETYSTIEIVLKNHRGVVANVFTRPANRAQALLPWWRWTAWLEAALRMFTHAEDRAQALLPWWRWTAWLEAALRNYSFVWPFMMAGLAAPTKEPWWQWTVWLWAAMSTRRPESALHDMPERIDWAAAFAGYLDAIAERFMRVFYLPDREALAAKRRRGRPTDHLRRELLDILSEGGLLPGEISDLIEDQVPSRNERLRGRKKRGKAAAKPESQRSATTRKSKQNPPGRPLR